MFVRSPAKGAALAGICLVLLGVMPVIANSRPVGFDALSFALALSVWQTVFAVPLFAWEARVRRRSGSGTIATGRGHLRITVIGLGTGAIFGLSTYLYVLGVERAGAANAAIAIQAYPLFAILWESLFLKRRKTGFELLLTGGLIGALYFLGTGGTWRMSGLSPWFLVALGVPFLWSIAHVIIREELVRTPLTPAQITFFRVAISTLFLALVMALVSPQPIGTVLAIVFAGHAVAMGLVYYLELIVWFYAMRHIDVSLASSITTPWPALTMVLAYLFLGDAIEAHQVGALLVVIACIYGLTLAGIRKQRVKQV